MSVTIRDALDRVEQLVSTGQLKSSTRANWRSATIALVNAAQDPSAFDLPAADVLRDIDAYAQRYAARRGASASTVQSYISRVRQLLELTLGAHGVPPSPRYREPLEARAGCAHALLFSGHLVDGTALAWCGRCGALRVGGGWFSPTGMERL